METNTIMESLDRRLKWLFWLLLPGSLVYLVFALIITYLLIEEHLPKQPEVVEVIAADGNLAAGDVIAPTNLRLKNVWAKDRPKAAVRPDDGRVILRHKLIRNVPNGEPISWFDTDIPIPPPEKGSEVPNHGADPIR